MSEQPLRPGAPEAAPLGAARAALLVGIGVAAVDALAVELFTPLLTPRPVLRLLRGLACAGPIFAATLLVAGAAAGLVWISSRLRLGGRARLLLGFAALTAAALGLSLRVLPDDLGNLAGRLAEQGGGTSLPLLEMLLGAAALGIPLAAALGRLFGRRRVLRASACVAAALVTLLHPLVVPHDYPGVRLFVVVSAASFAAAALAHASVPRVSRALGGRAARVALAALLLFGVGTLVAPPGEQLAVEIARAPGASLSYFVVGRLGASESVLDVEVPPAQADWFSERAAEPSIPPSAPGLAPPAPIVLLLVVDSLRADVVLSGEHDARVPNLARLRRESRVFTQARAPGSQTAYTMSAIFSGKYFSQQYWLKHPTGAIWPHADESVRFPSILAAAGVPTVTFSSNDWLINQFGVIRGLTEEAIIKPKAPPAHTLAKPALERISRAKGSPLFLYLHFLDAHSPYNRGGTKGTPFNRYLAEVTLVDTQIGRIHEHLRAEGLQDRAILVITSDHGQAFGEHGTTQHAKTLYDELLRVPLLIHLPDRQARTIDVPVSLIDLGPTILDLFGQPTPGDYMGQSLVPLLRGEDADLTRPIAAEGRLKQSMVFPDGIKVIRDQRERTLEIYDTRRDPGELTNLVDDLGQHERKVRLLRKFFEVHTLKRPGYVPPYRR